MVASKLSMHDFTLNNLGRWEKIHLISTTTLAGLPEEELCAAIPELPNGIYSPDSALKSWDAAQNENKDRMQSSGN